MSQHFKSKYDQMRENSQSTDPASQMPESSYTRPIRNICFVLEDGSITFLNYGYLILGNINTEKEKVTLLFTSHQVEIEGHSLQPLFENLMTHSVSAIEIQSTRYHSLEVNPLTYITKILIDKI